jgi:hypothetical protein
MGRKRAVVNPSAAADFVYAFHLPKRGKAACDWVAGPFQQITGHPADTLQKRGWEELIYPKDGRCLRIARLCCVPVRAMCASIV